MSAPQTEAGERLLAYVNGGNLVVRTVVEVEEQAAAAERARLAEPLESAISLGHNLASPGLGHSRREWDLCPQPLCARIAAILRDEQ